MLKNSQKSYKAKVDDISAIVCSDLDNNQKIREIEYVLEQDNLLSQEQLELLQTLENEVYRDEALAFYETWQKRSIWLNNRVGQIVCNLVVNKPNSDKLLAEAIEHYKINKGKISKPPLKITWLTDKQQQALWETNEKGKEVFQTRAHGTGKVIQTGNGGVTRSGGFLPGATIAAGQRPTLRHPRARPQMAREPLAASPNNNCRRHPPLNRRNRAASSSRRAFAE